MVFDNLRDGSYVLPSVTIGRSVSGPVHGERRRVKTLEPGGSRAIASQEGRNHRAQRHAHDLTDAP